MGIIPDPNLCGHYTTVGEPGDEFNVFNYKRSAMLLRIAAVKANAAALIAKRIMAPLDARDEEAAVYDVAQRRYDTKMKESRALKAIDLISYRSNVAH